MTLLLLLNYVSLILTGTFLPEVTWRIRVQILWLRSINILWQMLVLLYYCCNASLYLCLVQTSRWRSLIDLVHTKRIQRYLSLPIMLRGAFPQLCGRFFPVVFFPPAFHFVLIDALKFAVSIPRWLSCLEFMCVLFGFQFWIAGLFMNHLFCLLILRDINYVVFLRLYRLKRRSYVCGRLLCFFLYRFETEDYTSMCVDHWSLNSGR